MNKRYLGKTLEWLLGDNNQPFEYTHHAVLLVASVLYLCSAVFNYGLELTSAFNIYLQYALSLLILMIWYLSRWKMQFHAMRFVFIGLVVLVSIPANWIGNAGSNGPTYLMIFGCLSYISVSFKDLGWYRRLGQLFCIIIPIPLILIEKHYPDIIFQYATEEQKQFDLTFAFIIMGLFLVVMMESLSTRFKLERAKAETLAEQLRALSEKDALTGLFNRRMLEKEFLTWKGHQPIFSLALLDLDHFKYQNDQWGHSYGDEILKSFSALLQETAARNKGLAIRQGGEEFVLLLPLTLDDTYRELNYLAESFRTTDLEHGPVTFSAGIAENTATDNESDLLKRADKLMYQAKDAGRNRICR
ncbi:GGDEF domain-containing protein [Marinomonas gallaica]|uniref:GGDEF domain-containing protein n=1 Tax=Marinomonas gallaica TaxID=1806667 RepID=UPI000836F9A6|nr:GGDEF domain-containing protein [Marinomonas gallaica]